MNTVWDILPGLGDKLAAHVVLSASAIGLAMLTGFMVRKMRCVGNRVPRLFPAQLAVCKRR